MHLTLLFIFLQVLNNGYVQIIVEDEPIVRYHIGDDPAWAAKDLTDSSWATMRGNTGDRIFWSRTRFHVQEPGTDQRPLGLQVNAFGAFEVYWDGVRIGSNGRLPRDGQPEQPGTETTYYLVPDSLSVPGEHVVAMRMSQTWHPHKQRSIGLKMEAYTSMLTYSLINTAYMHLMAGAFLIASLYYFFLYFSSRKRQTSTLLFATICLLFGSLLIIEYLKFHVYIPYSRFFVRLEAIGWLTFANALLVPLYFTIQFHFNKKWWLMGLLLGVLLWLYYDNYGNYDITARYYSLAMLITMAIVVLNAIWQKEKGAFIVLAGLAGSVLVNQNMVYDFGLFVSFTLIVLCMLYLHAIRTNAVEAAHQEALLHSSRLQLELLKKNIQPHFLRNTLTSMMDWVEESPKEGARFIQALSAEFDIMNAISDQTLIPIRQEIELCRQHLSVMAFRKEISFQWEESGIDETQTIPPAVLHTLLENGITHSMPLPGNTIVFTLRYSTGGGFRRYDFETKAINREIVTGRTGGHGFKYIEARLTESYGQQWAFHSAATPAGWLSTIQIVTP